jgi:hypothetical protein
VIAILFAAICAVTTAGAIGAGIALKREVPLAVAQA